MILKNAFLRPILSATILVSLVFSFSQVVQAQDDGNGVALGRLKFGKQTDDKWLKVDLRNTTRTSLNPRIRGGQPTVTTNQRPTTSFNTAYARTAALQTSNRFSSLDRSKLPVGYRPASTMVSNHRLLQAASIAVNRAHKSSRSRCWRYVKTALLKAEVIDSYPKTGYAKQAAWELVQDYGFVRTQISNPFAAPIGSVLVYGGRGAGHVEIRTREGFVSDFVSLKPSPRPLIGVFVKR